MTPEQLRDIAEKHEMDVAYYKRLYTLRDGAKEECRKTGGPILFSIELSTRKGYFSLKLREAAISSIEGLLPLLLDKEIERVAKVIEGFRALEMPQ
jgi:hypothetical protein